MESTEKLPPFIETLKTTSFIKYCDYNTLISLSACCKEANEIVHKNGLLHSKSRVIVDMEFLEIDFLMWLTHLALKGKFNYLRMLNARFEDKENDMSVIHRRYYLAMLFETLGETVYDIKMKNCDIGSTTLMKILKNFKNLTKLTIRATRIKGEALQPFQLDILKIEYSGGFSLMNFKDIKQLSALCTTDKNNEAEVESVLKKQKLLESVYVNFPLQLENLRSEKIKSLNIDCVISSLDAYPFFLKRQPEMKELSLVLSRHSLQNPAGIGCVLYVFKLLTKVNLVFPENKENEDGIDLDDIFSKVDFASLEPTYLEHLYMYDELGIAGSFISIFQDANKITCRPTKGLKFTGNFTVDPANFKKINAFGLMAFEYSAESVPEKRLLFETGILDFLGEHSARLSKVKIGHGNWNIGPKGSLNLSLKFCKSLVENLPKLESLELYGMIEVGRVFIKYLNTIERSIEVNLHMEQFLSSEGPPEKRVKLNVSY